MTYDEYQKTLPDYVPPPMPSPLPSPPRDDGMASRIPGRAARVIANAVTYAPPGLGENVYNFMRNTMEGAPTSYPSFTPMPGERPALQMPGLQRVKDFFTSGYENDPTGFRDMPRSPYAPYIHERNTQVIPGPVPQLPRQDYTPPPFMNFRHWMDTGERGPLPLDAMRPGSYPAPYYRPMPEAYDARTSGGFLADAGRAALRGVAGQPMAQLYGPMQNVTNAMMLAEAAKTDDERARERMRPVLDEYNQAALEPLMMRKYAERMGYMPTPSVWKRIWRSIVENYSQSDEGLTRGQGTPPPRR